MGQLFAIPTMYQILDKITHACHRAVYTPHVYQILIQKTNMKYIQHVCPS